MAGAVLVAGGTGALGSAVVRELVAAGHPVTATWVVERERARLEGMPGVELVEADLFDAGAARAAVDSVDSLTAVVNLVGGYAQGDRMHDVDPDELDRMLRLNLRPAWLLAQAAMPGFVEAGGGAFVAVSARTALRPFSGAAAYAISKAGVIALVQALDAEYRQDGIRVNAILPSVIDTPANRENEPDANHSKWVQPEQIAKVIRFLVSDDSAVTSGAAIPVYGRA
jgi:NAD(P)-dependent dehydrogenase (short-subunit alcohol dehydrogenase family)